MFVRVVAGRLATSLALVFGALAVMASPAAAGGVRHVHLNCAESSACAEVANYKEVFGNYYVGHDEPSTLFFSNKPGSGNHMRYTVTLPKDPSPSDPNA